MTATTISKFGWTELWQLLMTHIQTDDSDHCTLLIRLQRNGWLHGQRRHRPFRYENMWRRHETYDSMVSADWTPGCTSIATFRANLKGIQDTLTAWEHDQFRSVCQELSSLRRRLEEVRSHSLHSGPSRDERDIIRRLAEVLAQ